MNTVALNIAQKSLLDLIEDVKLGSHIVITQDKEPVAELIPIPGPKSNPKFGSAKGLIKVSDDFDNPIEDFKEYTNESTT